QAAMLEDILTETGFRVEVASDAERALVLLRSRPFDLIISDIVMPGMSGYELCRAVKEDARLCHLPVILLTSLDDPLEIVKALEAGADNFISKPYEGPALIARLKAFLTNRRMRAEGQLEAGVDVLFLGRRFTISSNRTQILDLLLSTFETTVRT